MGAFATVLFCQLTLMPALSFSMSRMLELNDLHSVCLVLLGTCPGGSASNILVYFTDGDQALSIAVTCVTNILSVGTLPLLLFLWSSSCTSFEIPYFDIMLSLTMVV